MTERRRRQPPDVGEALAPVRDALLRAAREEAERTLARADETAQRLVSEAQAQADQIRAQARAQGAADSAERAASERSRTGRQARSVVLAAQRAEYEALRSAAREAVATLCHEPDYPDVRRRLTAILRRLLGEGAQVRDVPGGGVTATVPGRSADLSLARLADRAVDAVLADESDPADGAAEPTTSDLTSPLRAGRGDDHGARWLGKP